MVSNNKKLHVLKLFYRANSINDITGIFNLYLNYVIPEKILISTTQSPARANEWREYYEKVLKTPQPPRKIYLFMIRCVFYDTSDDYFTELYTFQNYDPRIRLVFADDDKYYKYNYSSCMKSIEFYMNHGYPQKMVRSVKFGKLLRSLG
uniref:Uncharacterized protein n=1 Tax=Acrobeloides nanus TaxID=290746 RepID=A0A914DU82_9BILA